MGGSPLEGERDAKPAVEALSPRVWAALAKVAARSAGATTACFAFVAAGAARVVGACGAGEAPPAALAVAVEAVAADGVASREEAGVHLVAVPVRADGRALAALCASSPAPFGPDAVDALVDVAELATAGFAEHTRVADASMDGGPPRPIRDEDATRGAEALRDANERLSALIRASPLAIYTVDPEGLVTSWNPAAERIFGWTAEEAIGGPLPFVQGDKAEEFERLRRRMLRGEHFSELALTRRRRDGVRLELSVSTAPLHDAQGRTSAIMAIAADVTGKRAVEDQLRQAQRLEALGRLAGGVAHDFNNLLAVVQSYAGLLRKSLDAADPRVDHVDQIQSASERAARVTRQLLAFGRQQVLTPAALDLDEIVRSSASLLGRVLGDDVEISLDLAPGLAAVRADPTQLEQVILNLCLNARDAMPDGGRLTMTTRADAAVLGAPSVELAVSDTGHGMDEATRELVFEPFFTTKQPGRGTGLGLATVYGIVQQTGGQVRVESQPGKGTTFRVYLPLSLGESASAQPVSVGAPGTGSESVLLVEDDALVRFVAARILRDAGYTVTDAPGPKEALAIVADAAFKFEVLLTDVVMPEMNGQRMARAIRATRPSISVLYMSGYPDTSFDLSGLGDRVAFLPKPFNQTNLLGALRKLLDGPAHRAPVA